MKKIINIILILILFSTTANYFPNLDLLIRKGIVIEKKKKVKKKKKPKLEELIPTDLFSGNASFYGHKFHNRRSSSGEVFNMEDFTAAHPTFPFQTKVKVTNMKNKKSVIVRVTDRMPKHRNRIIDVSYRAADSLGMIAQGIQKVKIEVLEWGKKK